MQKAKEILTSQGKFRIELGLERISKILKVLGNPEKDLRIIHVAGTNGKGSCCAILEEILTEEGFKTGKFTSPHLFKYNERITVNKRPISDLEFETLINKINEIDKAENIGLTEFETLTAAGFLYFNKKKCEVVILEVGLGGRFDATNVVKKPLASIIASISLEHTERLGNTIEKIAHEKAGIIKEGCPVVVLSSNKAFETIKEEACKQGGVLHQTETIRTEEKEDKNFAITENRSFEFGLRGTFQGENLALCLKTVEILNKTEALGRKISIKSVQNGIKNVKWPFRLEKRLIGGNEILIDACHNPDGARVLRDYLDTNYKNKKIKFIFGCLKNKDYESVLKNLFDKKPLENSSKELRFYCFNYPNALSFKDLPPHIKQFAKEITDVQQELQNPERFDLTVVCGSIYMLGQIFAP